MRWLPRSSKSARLKQYLAVVFSAAIVLGLIWHFFLLTPAYGALLGGRVLQLADNEVSVNTAYMVAFNLSTAGVIGSVQIQFCSNDPFPATPCTAPAGLDVSAAILGSQSLPGDFVIGAGSSANQIILTRPPAALALSTLRFQFKNIVNPASSGSYFVRLQTFASNDASGAASDYGGIAFAITNQLAISAEVPPYLIFCTGVTISGLNCANAIGNYIDFGELSTLQPRSGSSQMLVATNAGNGFNISDFGTTMTSGINTINALSANDVSRPGVGQFGFNLVANNTPPDGQAPIGPGVTQPMANYNIANSYRFVSGDTLVSSSVPEDVREFTASYIVNIPPLQAPGIYVTTITYICLATF